MNTHFEKLHVGKHFIVLKRHLKAGDVIGPKHDEFHRFIHVLKGQVGVQIGAFNFREYNVEDHCVIKLGLTYSVTANFDSIYLEVLSGDTEDNIL